MLYIVTIRPIVVNIVVNPAKTSVIIAQIVSIIVVIIMKVSTIVTPPLYLIKGLSPSTYKFRMVAIWLYLSSKVVVI